MAVRPHVAWYWRVLVAVCLLALVALIAWGTFEAGRRLAGAYEGESHKARARLELVLVDLRRENDQLRQELAGAERQVQIGLAANETLTGQLRELASENSSLREDLAFFQSLTAAPASPDVSIHRFQVGRAVLPGEYRYRLLVVQSRRRGQEFKGELHLFADIDTAGVEELVPVSTHGAGEPPLLRFKSFQRLEGTFIIPEGATLRRLHARVLEAADMTPRVSAAVEP
jgi:hypothetical protein